jgi:hypothetical protein
MTDHVPALIDQPKRLGVLDENRESLTRNRLWVIGDASLLERPTVAIVEAAVREEAHKRLAHLHQES